MNTKKKALKAHDPLEFEHQHMIFQFASLMSNKYPELRLLNSSLNGVRLTPGQAVKAKKAGMKKGFPDIFLPVARSGFHGLFIELKRESHGVATQEQKKWLSELEKQGYRACICKGHAVAEKLILEYLDV